MGNLEESFELREKKILSQLDDLATYYDLTARRSGRRLRRYRGLVLFFSVSVTVLSGIPELKAFAPWSVTVAAGLSTFFAGLLTTSKIEESYIDAMDAAGRFRREVLLYESKAGVYVGLEAEKQLQVLVERIAAFDEQMYSKAAKRHSSGGEKASP
jgi:hypothetical protein